MIKELGRIDLYLLDQLMKERIHSKMRLLDAGYGHGRNAQYFIENNFDIWGIDLKLEAKFVIDQQIDLWNPNYDKAKFSVGDLIKMPFPDNHFDFVLSSAVLHFAESRAHFIQLFEETIRVLKPGGIFWFRMTTKHTLVQHAKHLHDDIYALPDGSTRYLLDVEVLKNLMQKHQLHFLDPFKTVNVSDLRTMAVVVLIHHP